MAEVLSFIADPVLRDHAASPLAGHLVDLRKYMNDAWYVMLPFYKVSKSSERRRMIKSGAMHGLAKVLQECHWASVADKMDAHDARMAPTSN